MGVDNPSSEHWDKLLRLIELAKADDAVSHVLRHGSPAEVVKVLQADPIRFSMDEIGEIFSDLEYIADRNSLAYWSPLR